MYRTLTKHYVAHIKDVGIWDDALAQIGELYFGIRIPRQGNPLMDMMGSMFGGGAPAPAPKAKAKAKKTVAAPPPPAADLD